jgi:hypothetical protein
MSREKHKNLATWKKFQKIHKKDQLLLAFLDNIPRLVGVEIIAAVS